MVYCINSQNNNVVIYPVPLVQSVAEMTHEHLCKLFQDTVVCINLNAPSLRAELNEIGLQNHKYVLYNLEHKWPAGYVLKSGWNNIFKDVVGQTDFVLNFEIEDYPYFKAIGHEHKFKFFPLRYTTWFEQFIDKSIPKNYEIQFDGKVDTDIRRHTLTVLMSPVVDNGYVMEQIQLLISNSYNQSIKFRSKQMCKFCLDAPHYDYSETINLLRIFENLCLDCPTIVYDRYGETMNYFPNLIHIFNEEQFNTLNLKNFLINTEPESYAQRFKELTYDDIAYDNYRISILREFRDKYGIMIPDTVLEIN